MEYVTLNNGVKMPILGYGVYQVTKEECERCVLDALKHISLFDLPIDTAQSYFNERGVGEGSAPVESREKTYLLCQKLQQSTRHMSRQWRESMKP